MYRYFHRYFSYIAGVRELLERIPDRTPLGHKGPFSVNEQHNYKHDGKTNQKNTNASNLELPQHDLNFWHRREIVKILTIRGLAQHEGTCPWSSVTHLFHNIN